MNAGITIRCCCDNFYTAINDGFGTSRTADRALGSFSSIRVQDTAARQLNQIYYIKRPFKKVFLCSIFG